MTGSKLQISYKEALNILYSIDQEHLLNYWHTLSFEKKNKLLLDIQNLNIPLFLNLKKALISPLKQQGHFPCKTYFKSSEEDLKFGLELMKQGKAGCIVLAGGQGSRLRFEGPKGCFPISLIKHKTLFQLIFEKVKAASVMSGYPLPLGLMTSPLNHEETIAYLKKNDFFDLIPEKQLFFFTQETWPLLNFKGDLFLQDRDEIAKGPNGNGGLFRHFTNSNVCNIWKAKGVEIVQIIPVDNPLALPFDPELLGFHQRNQNEITIKACERTNPQESVGVVGYQNEKSKVPIVIEYSELTEQEKQQRTNGKLNYFISNTGLFSFSLSFIERVSTIQLPFHLAKKAVKALNNNGQSELSGELNAWKFEEFIFDTFPFSNKSQVLMFPKELFFAPLKNLQGSDSLVTVQRSLLERERKLFEEISGIPLPPNHVFELSPQFYYPTEQLRFLWQNKDLSLNEFYI